MKKTGCAMIAAVILTCCLVVTACGEGIPKLERQDRTSVIQTSVKEKVGYLKIELGRYDIAKITGQEFDEYDALEVYGAYKEYLADETANALDIICAAHDEDGKDYLFLSGLFVRSYLEAESEVDELWERYDNEQISGEVFAEELMGMVQKSMDEYDRKNKKK